MVKSWHLPRFVPALRRRGKNLRNVWMFRKKFVFLQPVPGYIKNNPPTLIVAGIRKLGYVL